jgi:hypothetical protein
MNTNRHQAHLQALARGEGLLRSASAPSVERATRAPSLNWRGPLPRFHESVWGVVQKLKYLNAFTAKELRSLIAHPTETALPHPPPEDEPYLAGCDLRRLRALLPPGCESWPTAFGGPRTFYGTFHEAHALSLRFFPHCLQHGFHSVLFQSRELARCPEHQEPLRDSCAHCARRIPYWRYWSGGEAFECPCGAVLWETRDVIALWYPPASFGRRLDAFAHRLKRTATPTGAAWKIRAVPDADPEVGFSLRPEVVLAMPPRSHRLFAREAFPAERTFCTLALEHTDRPIRLSLESACARLIARTMREVRSQLSAHHTCLEAPTPPSASPPVFRPEECVVTNALRLWAWQWRTPSMQRSLHELLLWHVVTMLEALQERGLRARRPVPALPQWWPLWSFIGTRVLRGNFITWLVVADPVLAHCERRQSAARAEVPYPFPGIPFQPTMPVLWATRVSRANQYVRLVHDGDRRLELWNAVRCAEPALEPRDREGEEVHMRNTLTQLLEHPVGSVRPGQAPVASDRPGVVLLPWNLKT